MTTTLTQPAAKPIAGAVLQAGAVGILFAALLNLILYFLGVAIGALPAMSSMDQPITLIPVLIFTIGAGIVATLLYLVLTRFLAPGRANAVFLIIASLVLIGMAFTPVTGVVDPTVATVLVLEAMHLAAALPPMTALTRLKNAGQWPQWALALLLGLFLAGGAPVTPVAPVSPNATVPPLPTPAPSAWETFSEVAGDAAGEISANGITLAYESFGPADSETILLIGGTGRQLVDYARGYDPEGLARQGTVILVDRFEPAAYRRSHLGDIGAPTVVVEGDAGPIVPFAAAEELSGLIPDAELRVIPGLGHDIPAELVPDIAGAILAAAGRA